MNHLAIMRNPWFKKYISGEKTIESRISQNKLTPYQKVTIGDWIYPRQSGKKLASYKAQVKYVEYWRLGIYPESRALLDKLLQFKDSICIDEAYIQSKAKCKYLTLIWTKPIIKLENPFEFTQKGQKAWFVDFQVPKLEDN